MTETTVVAANWTPRKPSSRRAAVSYMSGWRLALLQVLISAVVLQYSTYLVHSLLWDRVIKILALLLLAVLFRYHTPSRRVAVTLTLYSLLFATALLGSAATADPKGLLQLVKFAMQWSMLPLIVLRFGRREAAPGPLLRLFVWWGALFALQAIALSAVIMLRVPVPMKQTVLERYQGSGWMTWGPLGVLGYSNAWSDMGAFQVIRPQSWFVEPSTLSAFLIYPMLMSFAYFRTTSRRKWLAITVVLALGFTATFSLAGFIAVGAGTVALLLIRPGQTAAKRLWSLAAVFILPLVVIAAASTVLSGMQDLYRRKAEADDWTPLTRVLARDPENVETSSLVRAAFNLKESIDSAVERPLGVGLGSTLGDNELNSPNAALFWLRIGGIPGLLAILALQAQLLFAYALPLLRQRNPIGRAAAASYIAVTVHGLSYGTWAGAAYVSVVAMMILVATQLHGTSRVAARRSGREPQCAG